VTRSLPVTPGPSFEPLPPPSGPPPYRRRLADVLALEDKIAIRRAGALRFHCVGDTGGMQDPRPQRRVAAAMVGELAGEAAVHFFYHLGDIVYPHGEEANYRSQFFSPYAAYSAPIFAIPGNHDGELTAGSRAGTLQAFTKTFCSPSRPLRDTADRSRRPAPSQPNAYWTLLHDWVTIVGLYTNVPEGGQVAADQLLWLTEELGEAPRGVTLILAMHHPVFSADCAHGSNLALGEALDECFARAGRAPDAVFSAHAHNYQRFARNYGGREIPYVVAGSGGFHERHPLGLGVPETPASFPGLEGVTLQAYQDREYGFMTVTAAPTGAQVVYTSVTDGAMRRHDSFRIAPAPPT
jgi:acid phosphatase type 7